MLRRLALCTLIVLSQLLLTSPALASANSTIEQATHLDASNSSISDSLTGDSGGAFRYYAIDYPGGGVPIPIVMRGQPGRGTAGVGTGFKVYGPSGLFGDAIGDDRSTTDSSYNLTLAHAVAGTYYIQVYNFVQGLPLSFQLQVSGLSGPAPAPAAPEGGAAPQPAPSQPTAPPSSPDQAFHPQARDLTTGGILPPNGAGSFAYYKLDYPGGGTNMTITLGYSPLAANSEQLVGFNLYRANPNAAGGTDLVGSSSQTGRDQSSATEGFTLVADAGDQYLLQVFSYLPDTEINYTLIVTGMTGPIAEVGDLSDPSQAFVLNASQIAAHSTLPGDATGRFHYYLLQYPGGSREVRVTVTFDAAPVGESEVGFNVWKSASERAGVANGALAPQGKRAATLTINQSDPFTFGIQVFNYSASGQSVGYNITVTGL